MPKISAYTAAATLTGSEEIPVVQSGSTVRTTAADIAALASGGVSSIGGESGAVTVGSSDSSVTITPSSGHLDFTAVGGGGGAVTSVAGETGAVTFGSSDSSVTITPSAGHVDFTAAGGGGGGGGSVPSTYDTMIKAEPGLLYYWPLSDASGGPQDLVMGRGLSANGSPAYHATSLLANGDLAMTFPTSSDNLQFDTFPVIHPNHPWTLEFFFSVSAFPSSGYASLLNLENTSSQGLAVLLGTSGNVIIDVPSVTDTSLFTASTATPYHLALVYDGSALYWWKNGTLTYIGVYSWTFPTTGSPTLVKGPTLTVQKLAFYNLALPKARLTVHHNAISSTTYSWPFGS
jgi:hypothetical protein